MSEEVKCYKCETGLDLNSGSDVPRSEECPKCYASIRVCKMCVHYDAQSYNECRETIAERIVEKEKANFCDHFKVGVNPVGGQKKADIFSAANALFKK